MENTTSKPKNGKIKKIQANPKMGKTINKSRNRKITCKPRKAEPNLRKQDNNNNNNNNNNNEK